MNFQGRVVWPNLRQNTTEAKVRRVTHYITADPSSNTLQMPLSTESWGIVITSGSQVLVRIRPPGFTHSGFGFRSPRTSLAWRNYSFKTQWAGPTTFLEAALGCLHIPLHKQEVSHRRRMWGSWPLRAPDWPWISPSRIQVFVSAGLLGEVGRPVPASLPGWYVVSEYPGVPGSSR